MDWNNDNRQTKHSSSPEIFFWEIMTQFQELGERNLLNCLLPVTLCNNDTAAVTLFINDGLSPTFTFCGGEDKANYFFYFTSQENVHGHTDSDPHFSGF